MQWHRSGLIASWEFSEEHIERRNGSEDPAAGEPVVEKHCERRWGAMVIIKSLQFLPVAISAALREATHSLHSSPDQGSPADGHPKPTGPGNMLHVALVGNPMSQLQDRYFKKLFFLFFFF